MFIYSNLLNLVNLVYLNLIFSYKKFFLKRKVVIFFHPKQRQTKENVFFIKDCFEKKVNQKIDYIFLHQDIYFKERNHFYTKERTINFLYCVDIFLSNFICDKFPKNCIKIYIHHNLYDDPWVDRSKEKDTCIRLKNYEYIFVATKEALKATYKMFKNNRIFPPKLLEVGYLKLDYLLNKIKKNKKKAIIIAPTGMKTFSKFTFFKDIDKIIINILNNTKYNIVIRPHPRDRKNKFYINLIEKFKHENKVSFDLSSNYLKSYLEAKMMITDISGTAYTFSFLTLSPVIFCEKYKGSLKNKFGDLIFFKNRNKIGKINYDKNQIHKSILYVEDNIREIKQNISFLRKKIKFLKKSKRTINFFVFKILNGLPLN